MNKAVINGAELEFEVRGDGEPVLLIPNGPIAGCFQPFMSARALAHGFRLIRYHQRGQAGSSKASSPVSYSDHAADAGALLAHLDVDRAHLVGHSTGASIALQLAADQPQVVNSLVLLEPLIPGVPSASAFFEQAGPALASYTSGDPQGAMAAFLAVVSGLKEEESSAVLERLVPGALEEATVDAANFFESILPAFSDWRFGAEEASSVVAPVLSVLGSDTHQWFKDGDKVLRTWFPQLENRTVQGVGHFLHLQDPEPVAQVVAAYVRAERSNTPAKNKTPSTLHS